MELFKCISLATLLVVSIIVLICSIIGLCYDVWKGPWSKDYYLTKDEATKQIVKEELQKIERKKR